VRVLPALVIWSAFYMVVISGWVSGQQWTPSTVLDRIVTGQTYTHLYFLWAITGLYLLSPLIEAFLRPAEGRRAWVLGLGACAWTLVSMALPHLTADASTPEREPVQTTSLTYALVYAGYYILGRAALVAPIPKRWARVCLGLAVPVVAGIVLLKVRVVDGQAADAGPIEQSLVPSYVSPMVMLYAVLVFAAASSLLQDRRVGPGTQKVLRLFGNATFGVYLVHFAVIVLLRQIPALEDYTAGAMLAVYTVTVLVSTAFALLASRVPGLRLIV
jgi:surface polysaccharide O-acyltransferase-like enzyme